LAWQQVLVGLSGPAGTEGGLLRLLGLLARGRLLVVRLLLLWLGQQAFVAGDRAERAEEEARLPLLAHDPELCDPRAPRHAEGGGHRLVGVHPELTRAAPGARSAEAGEATGAARQAAEHFDPALRSLQRALGGAGDFGAGDHSGPGAREGDV